MTTFAEIGVRGDILKGLDALGFDKPTPVQAQIIPILLQEPRDLIGLAQTGTGKTAAFGIPLIQGIDTADKQTQALVLCPTRELCVQVAGDLAVLGRFVQGVTTVAVYGGASVESQITALKRGAHIIVATPGRLHDLMRRGRIDLAGIGTLVLDEADEMLQMGFQDELNAILAGTPADKNTLLFSATMPREVETISRKYMHDPLEITVGRRNGGAENVRHIYYQTQARDRYQAMRRIIDLHPEIYGIVFCRTRQETQEVAEQLIRDGYAAEPLHGDMAQGQRDLVMNKFRRRQLQLLVATDVAARGLDINDLSHVINYNLPDDAAAYTHRSGRTGRAGRSGISVSIIHSREMHRITLIEHMMNRKFEHGRIPSGTEICGRQLAKLIETVKQVEVHQEQIGPLMEELAGQLASLNREELIAHFVSHSFNRFLESYREAPDLNVVAARESRTAGYSRATAGNSRATSNNRTAGDKKNVPSPHNRTANLTRLQLNVGRKDGVHVKRLIGQINETAGTKGIRIGQIEIMNSTTTLEAESNGVGRVIDALNGLMINGKPVITEVAREQGRNPEGATVRKTEAASGWKGERTTGRKPGGANGWKPEGANVRKFPPTLKQAKSAKPGRGVVIGRSDRPVVSARPMPGGLLKVDGGRLTISSER